MKNYAYICYEQVVSEAEVELINQFWELEKGENIKFANNAQNVFKEFKSKLDKPLSIIKSKSSCTNVHSAFNCDSCNKKKLFSTRKECIEQFESERYVCKSCLVECYLKDGKLTIEKLGEYIEQRLKSESAISCLTYIEKLYLFLLLTRFNDGNKAPIKHHYDAHSETLGCEEAEKRMMKSLISKGFLVRITEHDFREAQAQGRESIRSFLDACLHLFIRKDNILSELPTYSTSFINSFGLYLRYSEEYSSVSELTKRLYDDICARKVSKNDVEEIQELLEKNRIYNILLIIEDACCDFKVTVQKSLRFGNLLQYLAKNYSLPIISYVVYKEARNLSAYLYNRNIPSYISDKLLTKRIEEYLDLIKRKNYSAVYTRRLPENIRVSEMEAFFCREFNEDCFNWFHLTNEEVLDSWISGATIEFNVPSLLS